MVERAGSVDSPPVIRNNVNTRNPGRFEESMKYSDFRIKTLNIPGKIYDDEPSPISPIHGSYPNENLNLNNQISLQLTNQHTVDASTPAHDTKRNHRPVQNPTNDQNLFELQQEHLQNNPTHTFHHQQAKNFDLFDFPPMNQMEEADLISPNLYAQHSHKTIHHSESGFEEDRNSQGNDYRTHPNDKDIPRVRGGAVTQGFMNIDKRRKIDQRRANTDAPNTHNRNTTEREYPRAMNTQNTPTHSQFNTMYSQVPFTYNQHTQNDGNLQKVNHQEGAKNVSIFHLGYPIIAFSHIGLGTSICRSEGGRYG